MLLHILYKQLFLNNSEQHKKCTISLLHFGAGTETKSQLCHLGGNFYLVLAQSSHHLLIKSFKNENKKRIRSLHNTGLELGKNFLHQEVSSLKQSIRSQKYTVLTLHGMKPTIKGIYNHFKLFRQPFL